MRPSIEAPSRLEEPSGDQGTDPDEGRGWAPAPEAPGGDEEETKPLIVEVPEEDEEDAKPLIVEVPEEDEEETETGYAAAEVAASVTFLSPAPSQATNPVTMAVQVTGPVYRVEYWENGLNKIALGMSPSTGFAAIYNFWVSGERLLEARAFNSSGEMVASTTMLFSVIVEAPGTDWGDSGSGSSGSGSGSGSSGSGSSGSGSSGSDSSGSGSSGSGSSGSGSSGSGSSGSGSSPAASACEPGEIHDCHGKCAKPTWVNDGFCDDGSQYAIDFTCTELGMDGDDCGLQSQSPCEAGKILDCVGHCAKTSWIGDGICDDGSEYKFVLTCPELGLDGGDCSGSSNNSGSSGSGSGGSGSSGSGSSGSGSSGSSGSGGTTAPSSAGTPYFYQYANDLYPGSSCQNTSIAMVLAAHGWGGDPDDITASWGKDHAQSPSGLAQVFNSYASGMGISAHLVPHTNGSISGLQALLAAGKPTIIHGYFTSSGHVVVVTGYDGTHYTVNDPAGAWNQSFKGSYGGGSTSGKGITYGKAAFELAVSSLNGSNYAPLWYHELVP